MLLSPETEGDPAICDNMDGPWGHYAKWSKSDRERQTLDDLICMQNLKQKRQLPHKRRSLIFYTYVPGTREDSLGIYVLISVIPKPALLSSSRGPRPQGSAAKLGHLAGHLWENCPQSSPHSGKLSPGNISRQLLLFMLTTPVFTGVMTQRNGWEK